MESWKTSPWKELDVEGMEQELKRFAKELRGLDKDCRPWNAYIQAEADVRNMMTSLRAVTELQNPAIRERHWQELMDATKVFSVYLNKNSLEFFQKRNIFFLAYVDRFVMFIHI